MQGMHRVWYDDGERADEDLACKKHRFPGLSGDVINPDAPSDTDSDQDTAGDSHTLSRWSHVYLSNQMIMCLVYVDSSVVDCPKVSRNVID